MPVLLIHVNTCVQIINVLWLKMTDYKNML